MNPSALAKARVPVQRAPRARPGQGGIVALNVCLRRPTTAESSLLHLPDA